MDDLQWIEDIDVDMYTPKYRIIPVYYPAQSKEWSRPEHIQLIDGEVKEWCVRSEILRQGETFQHWWSRKQEEMKNNPNYDHVTGIYFYNIQPIQGVVHGDVGMIISFDYIKNY